MQDQTGLHKGDMMVETCAYCGKEILPEEQEGHHVSYKPEVIVPLHRACHYLVHNSHVETDLKPVGRKKDLFDGKVYISVYIDEGLLGELDSKLEGRSRNLVLNALVKAYVGDEFEIKDWG